MTMSVVEANRLLGLSRGYTNADAKAAYNKRKESLRGSDNLTTQKLLELQEALAVSMSNASSNNGNDRSAQILACIRSGTDLPTDITKEDVENIVYNYLYELAMGRKNEEAHYAQLLALIPSISLFRLVSGHFRDRVLSSSGIHPLLLERLNEISDVDAIDLISKFALAQKALPTTLVNIIATRQEVELVGVLRKMRTFASEEAGDEFLGSIPNVTYQKYKIGLRGKEPYATLVPHIARAHMPSEPVRPAPAPAPTSAARSSAASKAGASAGSSRPKPSENAGSSAGSSNGTQRQKPPEVKNYENKKFNQRTVEKEIYNMHGGSFRRSNFDGLTLTGFNFTNADFTHASLINADLTLVIIENTSFFNANLSGANLSGIIFRDGSSTRTCVANFTGALCNNAKFINSFFNAGTSFEEADCSGADFTNARLDKVYMKGIMVDDKTNFTGTCFAKFPKWYFNHIGDTPKDTVLRLMRELQSRSANVNDVFIKDIIEQFSQRADVDSSDNYLPLYNELYAASQEKLSFSWLKRWVTPTSSNEIRDMLEFTAVVNHIKPQPIPRPHASGQRPS